MLTNYRQGCSTGPAVQMTLLARRKEADWHTGSLVKFRGNNRIPLKPASLCKGRRHNSRRIHRGFPPLSGPPFLGGEASELIEAMEPGQKSQLTWSGALWHPSSGNSLRMWLLLRPKVEIGVTLHHLSSQPSENYKFRDILGYRIS